MIVVTRIMSIVVCFFVSSLPSSGGCILGKLYFALPTAAKRLVKPDKVLVDGAVAARQIVLDLQ